MTSDESAQNDSSNLQLTLKFSGPTGKVCLSETVFFDGSKPVISRLGRKKEQDSGIFLWTRGVQSLCLFLIRYVGHPKYEFSGKKGSDAATLSDALAKGDQSWLLNIFGSDDDGTSIAKTIFEFQNPGQRNESHDARVWILSTRLTPENVHILLNERDLAADELPDLENEIVNAYRRTKAEEAGPASSGPTESSPFYDSYRKIWRSDGSVFEKVLKARDLLSYSAVPPFLDLLHSVRIDVDEKGFADFQFEVVSCNCGQQALNKRYHNFWFERPLTEPLLVHASDGNTVEMAQNKGSHRFAIVFAKPIVPGDVQNYRFTFQQVNWKDQPSFWEFRLDRIINHLSIHITDRTPGRLAYVAVKRMSEVDSSASPARPLVVVDWGRGIDIYHHFEFPELNDVRRIYWQIEEAETSASKTSMSGN